MVSHLLNISVFFTNFYLQIRDVCIINSKGEKIYGASSMEIYPKKIKTKYWLEFGNGVREQRTVNFLLFMHTQQIHIQIFNNLTLNNCSAGLLHRPCIQLTLKYLNENSYGNYVFPIYLNSMFIHLIKHSQQNQSNQNVNTRLKHCDVVFVKNICLWMSDTLQWYFNSLITENEYTMNVRTFYF